MQTSQKIALVTGASRGLGKDMALRLAESGVDIIITYKANKEDADAVLKQIRDMGRKAEALPLDMSVFTHLPAFVDLLKKTLMDKWNQEAFDYLINNAGMGATVPFLDVTPALFDEFLNVHFKGIYFLTQNCVPMLNEGGCIINISTGTTRFTNPGYSVYASMKGAIEVFTKYLAKELGSRGIRANVVAPGPIETDFNKGAIRNNPEMKTRLSGLSPLNRVGRAEDIGGIVAFLCNPDSYWINAQRIEVSGGINS